MCTIREVYNSSSVTSGMDEKSWELKHCYQQRPENASEMKYYILKKQYYNKTAGYRVKKAQTGQATIVPQFGTCDIVKIKCMKYTYPTYE